MRAPLSWLQISKSGDNAQDEYAFVFNKKQYDR